MWILMMIVNAGNMIRMDSGDTGRDTGWDRSGVSAQMLESVLGSFRISTKLRQVIKYQFFVSDSFFVFFRTASDGVAILVSARYGRSVDMVGFAIKHKRSMSINIGNVRSAYQLDLPDSLSPEDNGFQTNLYALSAGELCTQYSGNSTRDDGQSTSAHILRCLRFGRPTAMSVSLRRSWVIVDVVD